MARIKRGFRTYLMAFEHLGVEIIGLVHVEVRDDVFSLLALKHVPLEGYVMKVLVVFLIFKVIHDRHLRGTIFQKHLNWDRRSEAARH